MLLGSRCRNCSRYYFPQRDYCAACSEKTTEIVELAGDATLTSFTRLHRKPEYSVIEPPYVLAEVTLPEGPRIYSILVEERDREPEVGEEVRLRTIEVKRPGQDEPVIAYAFALVGE